MGCVMRSYWLHEDCRGFYACARYILFRCCKKAKSKYRLGKDVPEWESSIETEYHPINFLDFKWIVDRCNFLLAKRHGLDLLPNDWLYWHDEAHMVPEKFACDFACDYKKLKNGTLKKIKPRHGDYKEEDFMSGAEIYAMNKIIRRWKIYGRWFVKFSSWCFLTKMKIRKLWKCK